MRLADEKALQHLLATTKVRIAGSEAKPAVAVKKAKPAKRSELESVLQAQIEASGLPAPEYDVTYLIGSRHRLDVCWRSLKFGVECQGLQHGIKGRYKADIIKRVQGQLQGWLVLEVDGEAIRNGSAIQWLQQLIKERK